MGIQRLVLDSYIETRRLGPRFLVHHAHRRPGRTFRVRIKGLGPVLLRACSSDPAVFSQVFAKREYDFRHFKQFAVVEARLRDIERRGHRPLILDLGANNGASAMWFARMFPTAHVVAVEPDPGNLEMCRANTQPYDVQVLAAAIGSSHGAVTLNSEGRGEWGVSTTRDDHGDVPVLTVGDIIASQGDGLELLLVKVDIEGFEDDLFADHVEWVDEATVIILEPHDWMLPGRGTSANFQRVLGSDHFEVLISGENLIYVRSGAR